MKILNPPKEDSKEYSEKRYKFIKKCLNRNIPVTKIAKLLGLSRTYVYTIGRYGLGNIGQSFTSYTRNKLAILIKERDKYCRVCGTKKNLKIHHLLKSENHSTKNLIALCGRCHSLVEWIKKNKKKEYRQFIKETKEEKSII